jgi:hypothetical protein
VAKNISRRKLLGFAVASPPGRGRVRELWTGVVLDASEDGTLQLTLPGRSGRVLLTALEGER